MAGQIYKLFMGRFTEAWHQLSQEEQKDLMAKIEQALEQVGGKTLVLCNSGWASERWPFFGVEVFPDMEAVQKHGALLREQNWFRYVDTMSLLGTEFEM